MVRRVQLWVLAVTMFGTAWAEYSHGGYGDGGGHGHLSQGYGHEQALGHHGYSGHEHHGHAGYGPEVHYQPAVAKVAVPAVEKHVDYYVSLVLDWQCQLFTRYILVFYLILKIIVSSQILVLLRSKRSQYRRH